MRQLTLGQIIWFTFFAYVNGMVAGVIITKNFAPVCQQKVPTGTR